MVPTISPVTSILGYKRGEEWEYQMSATNMNQKIRLVLKNGGTNYTTATQVTFTGDGTGLAAIATVYPSPGSITALTLLSQGTGYTEAPTVEFSNEGTDASAEAIFVAPTWQVVGLPEGMTVDPDTGLISGAATVAGVFVCTAIATNIDGDSDPVSFAIGIEPVQASALTSAAIDLWFDVGSRAVTNSKPGENSGSNTADGPVMMAKLGDVVPVNVHLLKWGTPIDPSPSTVKFAMKEFEPDSELGTAGGATVTGYQVTGKADTNIITGKAYENGTAVLFSSLAGGEGLTTSTYYVVETSSNTFKLAVSPGGTAIDFTTDITAGTIREDLSVIKTGTNADAYWSFTVDFSGNAFAAALSNYESDQGTAFMGLAELEITIDGTPTIRISSRTFTVDFERDLVADA